MAESADVLYHLLVLWVAGGVEPAAVWAELERREGVSGIAEKAARSLASRCSPATADANEEDSLSAERRHACERPRPV